MDTLFSARALMGVSLIFHTFFTPIGIGLPLLLFITEGIGLRTGDRRYRELARAWTPAVGLLFAVGAVSGTVLSFELGLLWPKFMHYGGGIIGMPFGLEGFAFFTEAIFLAMYIYGWDRLSPRAHWLVSIPLFVSAAISSVFVISVNAWMNSPEGFRVVEGVVTDVDPWDAMLNASWLHEAIHGTLAAYVAAAFAVAAVCAVLMLRKSPATHASLALSLAMALGVVAILLQIVAGDFAARRVASIQEEKFAAMEGQYDTQEGAPLRIGGIPIDGDTRLAIELPRMLSLLTHGDVNAEVKGLNTIPNGDRPNEAATHISFQAMVGTGFALLAIAAWYWIARWRAKGSFAPGRWMLRTIALSGVLGFVAVQAGWFVTEFGRQPWVVRGFVRTSQGVTDRDGIGIFFVLFTLLYVAISAALVTALLRWPHGSAAARRPEPPAAAGMGVPHVV